MSEVQPVLCWRIFNKRHSQDGGARLGALGDFRHVNTSTVTAFPPPAWLQSAHRVPENVTVCSHEPGWALCGHHRTHQKTWDHLKDGETGAFRSVGPHLCGSNNTAPPHGPACFPSSRVHLVASYHGPATLVQTFIHRKLCFSSCLGLF